MGQSTIQTIRGAVTAESLGRILPHEHLFVDLRGPFVKGYAEADADHVVARMKPYLDELAARVSPHSWTARLPASGVTFRCFGASQRRLPFTSLHRQVFTSRDSSPLLCST